MGCILVPALCYGHTLVLPRNRKPFSLIKALSEEKVSFVIGTPTNFIEIMNFLKETGQKILISKTRGTVTGAPIPDGFVATVNQNTKMSYTRIMV